MKTIKEISEQIHSELEQAEWYYTHAALRKQDHPDLAKTYHQIGNEEMGHVDKLHGCVTKLIKEAREKQEPPKYMLEMWDHLHKMMIKKAAEVRHMGDMYTSM